MPGASIGEFSTPQAKRALASALELHWGLRRKKKAKTMKRAKKAVLRKRAKR